MIQRLFSERQNEPSSRRRIAALPRLLCLLVLAHFVVACSGVDADSSIVAKCTEELAEAKACLCSAAKFKKYVGAKDYRRYANFLDVFFVERENTRKYGEDETAYMAWSGAMELYAKESGEDRLEVMGDMTGLFSRHADAMQACGIDPNGTTDR